VAEAAEIGAPLRRGSAENAQPRSEGKCPSCRTDVAIDSTGPRRSHRDGGLVVSIRGRCHHRLRTTLPTRRPSGCLPSRRSQSRSFVGGALAGGGSDAERPPHSERPDAHGGSTLPDQMPSSRDHHQRCRRRDLRGATASASADALETMILDDTRCDDRGEASLAPRHRTLNTKVPALAPCRPKPEEPRSTADIDRRDVDLPDVPHTAWIRREMSCALHRVAATELGRCSLPTAPEGAPDPLRLTSSAGRDGHPSPPGRVASRCARRQLALQIAILVDRTPVSPPALTTARRGRPRRPPRGVTVDRAQEPPYKCTTGSTAAAGASPCLSDRATPRRVPAMPPAVSSSVSWTSR
jgi:hypothetical protein